ncbi:MULTISPECIES: hypothetical protein [unclassified Streptomyces]|uniref:hypothetical protein n=1 Tax=unclassified Streptomyces TaxID=2593676 RepID=UPI00226F93EF|nr:MULTISPECIES: hypothetical protein [unclassified Streptomyces]MCY0921869.1 hypothetical protein [Streptomyces sp. H27-G5]MCY0957181.1 hypothetical protein [Streptomyces sp. H27-H5]
MPSPTPLDVARRALSPAGLGSRPSRAAFEQGIRTSGMTPHTRLVALTLCTFASLSGDISRDDQPGLHGLVASTGLTAGQVAVQIRILEERGWVARLHGTGHKYETAVLRLAVPRYATVPRVPRN